MVKKQVSKRFTDEDDALLAELGVEVIAKPSAVHTAAQERIIAGFEEIQRFVQTRGHLPQHGEDRDIFERLYAVRLDRLRELPQARELLQPLDAQNLLDALSAPTLLSDINAIDDEALLALLLEGRNPSSVPAQVDVTQLRHVRSRAEIKVAEEIATREPCVDFACFKPIFDQVQSEIQHGLRNTMPFAKDASIEQGNFFILGGQLVYVAEVGETIKAPNGDNDARLRTVYSNGTQSNLLLRSLQRALYKDDAGRRVSEPDVGPLFKDALEPDDIESGTIYVLRSCSDHPFVAEHRNLVHKIGVTGGKVQARISHAAHDATYLLADVEVVATYKLANIHRTRLEHLLHRLFAPARIDLTIHDRFGHPVKPCEWFLVPLSIIDEAVRRIQDGSIAGTSYDPKEVRLLD